MLVLRGVAVVGPRWRGRNYIFEGDARGLLSQTSPQAAEVLLARCRESRPDVGAASTPGLQRRSAGERAKPKATARPPRIPIPGKAKPRRIASALWSGPMS